MYLLCNMTTKTTIKTFKKLVDGYWTKGSSWQGETTKPATYRKGTLEKILEEYKGTYYAIFCTDTKTWYEIKTHNIQGETVYALHSY